MKIFNEVITDQVTLIMVLHNGRCSNLDLPFLFRFLFTDFPKEYSRGPLLLVWFSSLRDLKQLLRESLGLANKSQGIYGTSFSEFVMMKSGLDDEISHWKKHSS